MATLTYIATFVLLEIIQAICTDLFEFYGPWSVQMTSARRNAWFVAFMDLIMFYAVFIPVYFATFVITLIYCSTENFGVLSTYSTAKKPSSSSDTNAVLYFATLSTTVIFVFGVVVSLLWNGIKKENKYLISTWLWLNFIFMMSISSPILFTAWIAQVHYFCHMLAIFLVRFGMLYLVKKYISNIGTPNSPARENDS